MIQIIGTRRLIILASLVAFNVVMYGAHYALLAPQSETLENETKKIKSTIGTKRTEIFRMQDEFVEIQKQKVDFENLKDSGFMGHQDRLMLRDRMDAVQTYARIISSDYRVAPVQYIQNESTTQADQLYLATEISANIRAIEDGDIYKYIYGLENGFPGVVVVKDLSMSRSGAVNDVTLRQLGTGSPVALSQANLTFTWYTMMPKNETGVRFTE
jgi:hypothetical protein